MWLVLLRPWVRVPLLGGLLLVIGRLPSVCHGNCITRSGACPLAAHAAPLSARSPIHEPLDERWFGAVDGYARPESCTCPAAACCSSRPGPPPSPRGGQRRHRCRQQQRGSQERPPPCRLQCQWGHVMATLNSAASRAAAAAAASSDTGARASAAHRDLMDDMAALQSVHTWPRHFEAHNARRGPIVQPPRHP